MVDALQLKLNFVSTNIKPREFRGEASWADVREPESSNLVLIRAKKDLWRAWPTWVVKYSLVSTHREWQSLANAMKESN